VSTSVDGADVRFPAEAHGSAADVRSPAEAHGSAADVRSPAEAHGSAAAPSTASDQAEKSGHRRKATDSGSLWLQAEIARRIAANSSRDGGRHARRDNPDPTTAVGYLPRHATVTPGPTAQAPPAPPKTPRRGPAGANGDTEAWSGPDRSARGRPVVGGPSRPSGAAAARLLSPPAAPPPAAPPPTAAPPYGSAPTGAWPATEARPSIPSAGVPAAGSRPPRDRDPGFLTAPVLDGPVRDTPLRDTPRRSSPASDDPADDDPADDDPAYDDALLDLDLDIAPDGSDGEILWSADALPPSAPVHRPPPGAIAVPEQREAGGPSGARFHRADDADDGSPKRVRVVLAERKGIARQVRTVVDIQEATAVGTLLRSDLIGSQLRVALRFAAFAGLTLGGLPLLFALFPAIGEFDVLGLRLPWLLLGVLVYPFLLGLGWWHTRTAERVEQNFADYVQE
jgi:hypothetical protein